METFLAIKDKKIARKSLPQFWDKLGKFRLRQKSGFLIKNAPVLDKKKVNGDALPETRRYAPSIYNVFIHILIYLSLYS